MPQAGSLTINNLDIATLAEKLDRMAVEVKESVSAGLGEFNIFDRTRLQAFINDIAKFVEYSSEQNDVDTPHSHRLQLAIKEPSVGLQPELENEAANHLIAEIIRIRENLVQSQSSVRNSGWMAHDHERVANQYIPRLQNFLTNYLEVILPVDKPETFDRNAGGKGK